eukprot:TRINITY_DN3803_c0_g1_i11.p2 TRINITY_DN3803_c0_g1~~TRINITY_DN3803_c0_g1_i11.p2  ORF type:complete len:102 (-),score=4.50 TRINITY_DN3803_c0_g1_i11:269-574(-)
MLVTFLLVARSRRILAVNEGIGMKHYSTPLEDPKECYRKREHRSKSLNKAGDAKKKVKIAKPAKQYNIGTELLPPIKFVLLQHTLEPKRPCNHEYHQQTPP